MFPEAIASKRSGVNRIGSTSIQVWRDHAKRSRRSRLSTGFPSTHRYPGLQLQRTEAAGGRGVRHLI
jgi:hypothetical protein